MPDLAFRVRATTEAPEVSPLVFVQHLRNHLFQVLGESQQPDVDQEELFTVPMRDLGDAIMLALRAEMAKSPQYIVQLAILPLVGPDKPLYVISEVPPVLRPTELQQLMDSLVYQDAWPGIDGQTRSV